MATALLKYSFLLFFFSFSVIAHASRSIIDQAGNKLILKNQAKRIISLSPNLTEILYKIKASNKLVGRDQASDFAQNMASVPVVSNGTSLNMEKILALRPDLILVEDGLFFNKALQLLKKEAIPIYRNKAQSLSSIAVTIEHLGVLTGQEKEANEAKKQFEHDWRNLVKQYKHGSQVPVCYVFWDKPLLTINHDTIINEMIEGCGGENVFAHLPLRASPISRESIFIHHPQLIITSLPATRLANMSAQMSRLSSGQIIALSSAMIERTGPRILLGMKEICVAINKKRLNIP